MHRRAFLSVAITGTTAVSGCLAQARSPVDRRGPRRDADQARYRNLAQRLEGVDSIEFAIIALGEGSTTPPSITFDPESQQVRIKGTMMAGNACQGAQLETVTYDFQTGELSVLVGVRKEPLFSTCPDANGQETYEVIIKFNSQFPESVTATHRNNWEETFTTTANAS